MNNQKNDNVTSCPVTINLDENEAYLAKTVCEHLANRKKIDDSRADEDETKYKSDIYNLSRKEIDALYSIADKIDKALRRK